MCISQPEEKEIQVWLGASREDEEEKRISLTACRIWNSFSNTTHIFYYSGFRFVNPSEEALDSIQALIDELSE